jgi:Glycosyl transferase family 2
VIAAYQAADTIAAAVESACSQNLAAREIIVVDDGSSDGTRDVLRRYQNRISVISQPNRGAAAARNTALEAASGEFVAILDADDTYDPGRLQALGALAAARPDLDIITTDAYFLADGERRGRFHQKNQFATREQRRAILRTCFVGGWPAIRRSRLLDVGGFDSDVRVAYDWDCWIRLILTGSLAGLVDVPYMDYHLGEGRLTSDRVGSLRERVLVLEKAASNPALRPEERPVLRSSLRHHRRRAALAQAEALMGASGPVSRRRLFGVAGEHGVPLRTRVRIAAAAAYPRLGQRILASRDSGRSAT